MTSTSNTLYWARTTIFSACVMVTTPAYAIDVATHNDITAASLNDAGNQDHATLAVTDAGIALVTWQADDASTELGLHPILGRLYDVPTGSFLSLPFPISPNLANAELQAVPDTEADRQNDRFGVAWSGKDSKRGWNVYFRIIDDQGNPVIPTSIDEQVQINSNFSDKLMFPDVAAYENGNFVVAWDEVLDGAEDMNFFLRLVKTKPASLGDICAVNSTPSATPPTRRYGLPDVAVHRSGLAAVAWENIETDSRTSVHLSIVDPSDCSLKVETAVDISPNTQRRPVIDISQGNDGTLVVAWTEAVDDTGTNLKVFMKGFRYSKQGNELAPIGPRVDISDEPASDQSRPSIKIDKSGAIAASWGGEGEFSRDIFFRIFDRNLYPLTEPFLVNSEHFEYQQARPALQLLDSPNQLNGREVLVPIVWETSIHGQNTFVEITTLSVAP